MRKDRLYFVMPTNVGNFLQDGPQFLQITVAFWREYSLLRRNGQWLKRVIAGFDPQTHAISHATRCVPTGLTGWDAGAENRHSQEYTCRAYEAFYSHKCSFSQPS